MRATPASDARVAFPLGRAVGLALATAMSMVAIAGAAFGQVHGRLVLDRTEISTCMPVSGIIEFRPERDTQTPGRGWAAFRYQRECLEVVIQTPADSTIVLDWAHLAGGLVVCWGPLLESSRLEQGRVYAYPVFLLKTRDRFLFDTAGEYRITYRFRCLEPPLEIAAGVLVVDGRDEERRAFVDAFSGDLVIVEPFCNALIADSVAGLPETSPYFEAWQVARANQLVGESVGRGLLNAESPQALPVSRSEWYINDLNSECVAQGVRLDQRLEHPRGVWRVLFARQQWLRGDPQGAWAPPVDGEGRIIIMPR